MGNKWQGGKQISTFTHLHIVYILHFGLVLYVTQVNKLETSHSVYLSNIWEYTLQELLKWFTVDLN